MSIKPKLTLEQFYNSSIALYGLGKETERAISVFSSDFNIIGLLDGFRNKGEIYGYPIISLDDVVKQDVKLIIVVARPGSCRAIVDRIGSFCEEKQISLIDIRGRDLLSIPNVKYDFRGINRNSLEELKRKIQKADVISFDLFDTLIMRKLCSYTDLFEIIALSIEKDIIPNDEFCRLRLKTEKELSLHGSPRLVDIYEKVISEANILSLDPDSIALREWTIDKGLMIPRRRMVELLYDDALKNKSIVVTTDSYYSYKQIEELLDAMDINVFERIYVSSEYNMYKSQGLYTELTKDYPNSKILHIGDDDYSDINSAKKYGIDAFKVYSSMELIDDLGGMGMKEEIHSIADRIKMGMFVSRIFNDPFIYDTDDGKISITDPADIGYCFCAPVITDYSIWFRDKVRTQGYTQILLGARDGWLIKKMMEILDGELRTIYFLTSRTAAVRAGINDEKDIEYVESMKYSGTYSEQIKARFDIETYDSDEKAYIYQRIIESAKQKRINYLRYIKGLNIEDDRIAFFDFVAKGTTQMFLQNIFKQKIKGFYFLQLESDSMKDKNLDVETYYSNSEIENSIIFELYYILETILTSPDPQIEEFDVNGNPIFSKEMRSRQEIECMLKIQDGIIEYMKDYINLIKNEKGVINKRLNECFLSLITKVYISDETFMKQKVEDLFYGRTTEMSILL
ncbi:MAG: hypothetical protein K6G12_07565 [Lachnospiraceae bacterium]|nr:hypothetical protein [Lachnospiraceae bacterium]